MGASEPGKEKAGKYNSSLFYSLLLHTLLIYTSVFPLQAILFIISVCCIISSINTLELGGLMAVTVAKVINIFFMQLKMCVFFFHKTMIALFAFPINLFCLHKTVAALLSSNGNKKNITIVVKYFVATKFMDC